MSPFAMVLLAALSIQSISLSEEEEEGGATSYEVFPTGYVRVSGRASGRGYEPRLKAGWYECKDKKVLQNLFDRAKANLASHPTGLRAEAELIGTWITVEIKTTKGSLEYEELDPPETYQRLGLLDAPLERLSTPDDQRPPNRKPIVDANVK